MAGLATFLTLLLTLLAVVYFALPESYRATSVVSYSPRPQSGVDSNTLQVLGEKYAVVAGSAAVLSAAARGTGEDVDSLRSATSVSLDPGTANLRIVVALPDPARASAAANAVAAELVRAGRSDALVVGQLTATAVPGTAVAWPPRLLLSTAAMLVALMAGLLASVSAHRVRAARAARTARPARTELAVAAEGQP